MSEGPPKQHKATLKQTANAGESSSLRTKDIISAPLQSSGLKIGITLPFVVHGTYRPDGPPATLIVFNLEFDQRFRRVIAISNFRYDDDEGYPEIYRMAPKGDYLMDVSKRPTSDTSNSGALGEVIELGLGLGWEPWAKKRGPTQIELYGGLEDREGSGVEGAIWNLDTKADGLNLPPNFMAAILLKHNDRDEVASFTADLELEVYADVLVRSRLTSQKLITKMAINPLKYLTDASAIVPEEVDSTNLSSLGDSDSSFLKTLGSLKVRNG
ncbi:hypothetical protein EV426DRAFT_235432 [Tirmania nivea]|nr:hypothetical protein EV426DRAFT_235432 [Tirmania nivea]